MQTPVLDLNHRYPFILIGLLVLGGLFWVSQQFTQRATHVAQTIVGQSIPINLPSSLQVLMGEQQDNVRTVFLWHRTQNVVLHIRQIDVAEPLQPIETTAQLQALLPTLLKRIPTGRLNKEIAEGQLQYWQATPTQRIPVWVYKAGPQRYSLTGVLRWPAQQHKPQQVWLFTLSVTTPQSILTRAAQAWKVLPRIQQL